MACAKGRKASKDNNRNRISRRKRREAAACSNKQYGMLLALDSVCLCARDLLLEQAPPSGFEAGQALAVLPRHMLQPIIMSFAHWKWGADARSSFKVLLQVAPCLEEDLMAFLPQHKEAFNRLANNHEQTAHIAAAIYRAMHKEELERMNSEFTSSLFSMQLQQQEHF